MPIAPLFSLIIISYLIGSIPSGVLVGRAYGFDPRQVGSGNVGMTNVGRAGGRSAAAMTFAGDLLKGLLPVLLARAADIHGQFLAIAGLAAFLGAVFSLFLRFKGGKGVATSLGVWIGLDPAAVGIALLVFVVVFALRRVVSLASLCAAVALPIAVWTMNDATSYLLIALAISAIVIVRHRANIERLLNGQEEAVSFGSHGRVTGRP